MQDTMLAKLGRSKDEFNLIQLNYGPFHKEWSINHVLFGETIDKFCQ